MTQKNSGKSPSVTHIASAAERRAGVEIELPGARYVPAVDAQLGVNRFLAVL
jgi:hypothetical protein